MIKISYILGRFSEKVGSRFQYFPINSWHRDLFEAKKLKIHYVEWIISDLSNPIFNEKFSKIIKKELKTKKIKILALGLDLLLKEPLFKINEKDLHWIIKNLKKIIKLYNIKRVTIPLEENAKISSYQDYLLTKKRLKLMLKMLSKRTKICIETDLSIINIKQLFNQKGLKNLGLLLDIGNIKANGYKLEDYINNFPNKIYGIHLKKRNFLFSKSLPITSPFKEMKTVLKNLNKFKNVEDICLQNFRSDKNYIKETKKALKLLKKSVYEYKK